MIRDFTFVCPTEILAFNDALAEFKTKVLSTCISFIKRLHFPICASLTLSTPISPWLTSPRKEGRLGPDLKLPLIGDRKNVHFIVTVSPSDSY